MDALRKLEKLVKEFYPSSIIGVADIDRMRDELPSPPFEVAPYLKRGIAIGVRLSDEILDTCISGPTRIYLHHYRQANALLDRIAFAICGWIMEKGFKALPIPASQIIDWKQNLGHLSHKWVANYAGLGWIGRNNLLVTPEFGAQVRLVTVLTDMELPAGEPMPFGCGECKACMEVCPVGAIKEDIGEFDRERCFPEVKRIAQKNNLGQQICGICIRVCKGRIDK